MIEEWRDIGEIKGIDYTGLYQVSSQGRVMSLGNGICNSTRKILKLCKQRQGYMLVCLYKNGVKKRYTVHRLEYEAFYGRIPNGMQVNHINEIKSDNRLENLNLMTPKENMNWGTAIKRRSEKQINDKRSKPVLQINKNTNEVIAEFPSIHQVTRELGYDLAHISACCLNKPHCNTAYGYKWKFKKGDY